jgi:hypothetical protein
MTIDMTHWRRMAACLAAGIAVMLSVAWAAADAHAHGDRSLQRAIDARLEAAPGARQVARNQILFADGVRVTISPSARAGSLCGAQKFCVWADAGYQGVQASFPQCTGNRPKTYNLRKYGLPPGKPGWVFSGVTSWRSNMANGKSAQFLDMQMGTLLRVSRRGGGHMPASKNDRAAWVDMLCVP